MSDKRLTNSFKSYIGFDDESLDTSNDDSFSEQLSVRLLPGEALIAEAQNVLMFTQMCERKQGKSGVLCVTNFKLSFVTTEEKSKDEVAFQDVLMLGENDVCLSNIDSIYLFGDKKRKLIPGRNIMGKVKGLHVLCKDMKFLSFSFKFSPVGHGKTLANTLLHHAFPKRHQLLFGYDYSELQYPCKCDTLMFREAGDWGKELSRTEARGWRLSAVNHDFQMSSSLPRWMVVPSRTQDHQLRMVAPHFNSGRPPLWSWSSSQGAALVRMADIFSNRLYSAESYYNSMLESVRNSHPRLIKPEVLDLTTGLPSLKELHTSFIKLIELSTPEDIKQFWVQDQHFLSLLESTKWLHYVSSCLKVSLAAATNLRDDVTVVLQEWEGRDICCVISCLAQLLLDPHHRSLLGFQSLIQREWVVMGHPFCTRLAHLYQPDSDNQSPMFLLFLDCCWQLIQQFPTKFQFTETYLTTLWDSAHISIFDTFMFDCERDRLLASAEPNKPLVLRSVWEELLSSKDATLFVNPIYRGSPEKVDYLPVRYGIPHLQFWLQAYCRHIPVLEITGGGNPQTDFALRLLSSRCEGLAGDQETRPPEFRFTPPPSTGSRSTPPPLSTPVEGPPPNLGSFYPFSPTSSAPAPPPLALLSSLSLNTSFHSTEMMLDSQSILNAPD